MWLNCETKSRQCTEHNMDRYALPLPYILPFPTRLTSGRDAIFNYGFHFPILRSSSFQYLVQYVCNLFRNANLGKCHVNSLCPTGPSADKTLSTIASHPDSLPPTDLFHAQCCQALPVTSLGVHLTMAVGYALLQYRQLSWQ